MFVIVLLFSALLIFTAARGLKLGPVEIPSVKQGVALGLDLVGGTRLTYQAQIPEGSSKADIEKGVEAISAMLEHRLENRGYKDASLRVDEKNNFIIDIPKVADTGDTDAELSAPANVEFVDYLGNVLLNRGDITAASAGYGTAENSNVSRHYITIELTESGYEKFKAATAAVAAYPEGENYLQVIVDGELISRPYVGADYAGRGIDTYYPQIMLDVSANETFAQYLAGIISSGNSSFAISLCGKQTIYAVFDEAAVKSMLRVSLVGLALVLLYLAFSYKLPGLAASGALIIQISLLLIVLAVSGAKLSLPGIAGILLSASISVGAYVLLFERMRDTNAFGQELYRSAPEILQKTDKGVFDLGAVFILLSAALNWLGADVVKSFGQALLIGTVLTLLSVMLVLKPLMLSLSKLPLKAWEPSE